MEQETLKSATNDWLCDRAECTVFSALNFVSLLRNAPDSPSQYLQALTLATSGISNQNPHNRKRQRRALPHRRQTEPGGLSPLRHLKPAARHFDI